MNTYLLDTNICVHFMKGQYDLQAKINSAGLEYCYLSEITIAELMFGVENSAQEYRERNLDRIKQLQAAFTGRVLLIGECFEEYARQKSNLRKNGIVVGEFDLLIGTTAVVHGLTLVTRNTRDFLNLEKINLENWIDN